MLLRLSSTHHIKLAIEQEMHEQMDGWWLLLGRGTKLSLGYFGIVSTEDEGNAKNHDNILSAIYEKVSIFIFWSRGSVVRWQTIKDRHILRTVSVYHWISWRQLCSGLLKTEKVILNQNKKNNNKILLKGFLKKYY